MGKTVEVMCTCYDCNFFREFPNYSNVCRKTHEENINPAFACSKFEKKTNL